MGYILLLRKMYLYTSFIIMAKHGSRFNISDIEYLNISIRSFYVQNNLQIFVILMSFVKI